MTAVCSPLCSEAGVCITNEQFPLREHSGCMLMSFGLVWFLMETNLRPPVLKLPNGKTLHFAASVHIEHIDLTFCNAQTSVPVELCIINRRLDFISHFWWIQKVTKGNFFWFLECHRGRNNHKTLEALTNNFRLIPSVWFLSVLLKTLLWNEPGLMFFYFYFVSFFFNISILKFFKLYWGWRSEPVQQWYHVIESQKNRIERNMTLFAFRSYYVLNLAISFKYLDVAIKINIWELGDIRCFFLFKLRIQKSKPRSTLLLTTSSVISV